MEKVEKERYITSTIGIVLAVIMLLLTLSTGIASVSGKFTAFLTLLFGGIGITSFFNPSVAEIFAHWMKKVAENQGRTEINQKQNKPHKSPQTGNVQGDLTINYGEARKEGINNKGSYNKEKVKNRLLEIKDKLDNLKGLNHKQGSSVLSPLKKEVIGIIHKIYSLNPERAEKRLIHKVLWIISNTTTEQHYQDWYEEDVKGLVDTIDVVLNEMELD